jgi:hypothetical protein
LRKFKIKQDIGCPPKEQDKPSDWTKNWKCGICGGTTPHTIVECKGKTKQDNPHGVFGYGKVIQIKNEDKPVCEHKNWVKYKEIGGWRKHCNDCGKDTFWAYFDDNTPPTQTTKHLDKCKYELPMFKDLGSQLDDLISKAHKIVEQQKEINSLLDK